MSSRILFWRAFPRLCSRANRQGMGRAGEAPLPHRSRSPHQMMHVEIGSKAPIPDEAPSSTSPSTEPHKRTSESHGRRHERTASCYAGVPDVSDVYLSLRSPAMLGPARSPQLDAPITISLDDLVPQDRLCRYLDAHLDLPFGREWVRDYYPSRGRASIDD